MSDDINFRLDRLQAEVTELRELTMMQLAIIQVMAIKAGIAPADYQKMIPQEVPTPFDIEELLKRKD